MHAHTHTHTDTSSASLRYSSIKWSCSQPDNRHMRWWEAGPSGGSTAWRKDTHTLMLSYTPMSSKLLASALLAWQSSCRDCLRAINNLDSNLESFLAMCPCEDVWNRFQFDIPVLCLVQKSTNVNKVSQLCPFPSSRCSGVHAYEWDGA